MSAPPCRYSEFCNLVASTPQGFCLLHHPNPKKNTTTFENEVAAYLGSGRSDFRRVQFPQNSHTPFREVTFPGVLDLRDAVLPNGLDLQGATLPDGLLLNTGKINHIHLQNANIHGLTEILVEGTMRVLQGHNATFDNVLRIRFQTSENCSLGAILRDQTTIRCNSVNTLDFNGATIDGTLEILQCRIGSSLHFQNTTFGPSSRLDLSDSTIRNSGLRLEGDAVPAVVILEGTRIQGPTLLNVAMGRPRMQVSAPDRPPLFDREHKVALTNLDLSDCRLLGNNLDQFEIENVQWRRWRMRSVLQDEFIMRTRRPQDFPVGNLRELYQVFKQKYQARGDHLRAGEFHYGEMEMKRREYGFPKRYFSPETLFWCLSGYGMGYVRALFWLIAMVSLSALVYWVDNQMFFSKDIANWLLFSLQVSTLQRPALPVGGSEGLAWIQTVQTILSPILIALFGIALRNRVRR